MDITEKNSDAKNVKAELEDLHAATLASIIRPFDSRVAELEIFI